MKQVRVLIAGAGMAGLTHALALAGRGHSVTVIESASQLSSAGAGIQLGPNGLKPLQNLGVLESVLASACRPTEVAIRAMGSGKVIANMNNQQVGQRYGMAPVTVLRADLQSALLAACQQKSAIVLHLNQALLPEKIDALHRRFDTTVLIGADGLWSQTRHLLGDRSLPRFTGKLALRALLPMNKVATALQSQVGLWLGPGAHVVHYPVSGGAKLNVVAMWQSPAPADGSTAWDSEAAGFLWQDVFSNACPELAALLSQCTNGSIWTLYDRPPSQAWYNDSVCLVGDAAHPMQAHLAQGASMAFEDAIAMGNCLGSHADFYTDFARFTELRYARTAAAQRKAAQYGKIYQAAGPLAWARNAYLASPLASMQSNGLAWLYAGQ